MTTDQINDLFESTGALLSGHFKLSSGKHSNKYFQFAKVLQYPKYAEWLSQAIADHFKSAHITLVVSPAIGGLVVGQEVGRLLGCRAIFAERDSEGKMALRRGFEIFPNDRVLLVEDVITTGGSVQEVYDLVEGLGVHPVAFASIVDRSNGELPFKVPYYSVVKMKAEVFEPENCPLCKTGSEAVKPGSRK